MTRDLFKKIRDTKGTFHVKMGTIKDRNCLDLKEAEDIKKRWQEYTEEYTEKNIQEYTEESEKAMAPHSSVLAWRIPGMGEPGGLPSMASHRVGHD